MKRRAIKSMANLFNTSRFSFVGEIITAKEAITTAKTSEKSEWFRTRMNVGVRAETNSQFLTMESFFKHEDDKYQLFGEDGKAFLVPANETSSEETLKRLRNPAIVIDLETDVEKKKEYTSIVYKVRNHKDELRKIRRQETITSDDEAKIKELEEKIDTYTKQIADLADNRKEFGHIKDAINHLNSKLPQLEGKKVKVTGTVRCNFYKGKSTLQYIPSFIEIVPNETESILLVTAEIFYDKDSVNDDTKEKKMIVNGYIANRVDKKDRLFPITIGLDYTAVDFENETHMAFLNFMKSTFDITDKKQVHKTKALIKIINGAEVVEFTEECLTARQKMQIAVGQKTLEAFKPRGNVYGNRVQELRLFEPILLGDFDNGAFEVFPVNELADYVIGDDSDVEIKDVKKEEEPVKQDAEDSKRQMMNALFK